MCLEAGCGRSKAFADARIAEDKENGRFVSGTEMMFGGVACSWWSKTRACVTSRSAGAENITHCVHEGCCDAEDASRVPAVRLAKHTGEDLVR